MEMEERILMGNKENALTALYVLDILKKYSDEDNIIPLSKIIEMLANMGIYRQRRAIYDIINRLIDYGYEISTYNMNKKGYYLMDRKFDKHEIRILLDSIASSKSITKKKSRELANKIYSLTSEPNARKLKKQIHIEDTVKCINEQIYINIDNISTAIDMHKKISFIYFDYNVNKEQVPRKMGKKYIESPIDMILHNGFYYLITYNSKHKDFTHYRIDRIKNIGIQDEELDDSYLKIEEHKNGFNTARYVKKAFNMFSGKESKIEIRFHNDLLNMVIDKFGLDVNLYKLDDEHFKVIIDGAISDGFVSWILQFGNKAKVLYPNKLKEKIKEEIKKLYVLYE